MKLSRITLAVCVCLFGVFGCVDAPEPTPEGLTPAEESMRGMALSEKEQNNYPPDIEMKLTEKEQLYIAESRVAMTEYLIQEYLEFDLVGFIKKQIPTMKKPDSVILIQTRLYNRLTKNGLNPIDDYAHTIQNQYGKAVWVLQVPTSYCSPEQVRTSIKHLYDTYQIKGVILAGQWRIAGWAKTEPTGYIQKGPLFTFYESLDEGEFTRDDTDPAVQGLKSTYNEFWRKTDYPHQNVSFMDGDTFEYGPEVWVVMWRATGVHFPIDTDLEEKMEVDQITKFLKKSVSYHTKQPPYFEGDGSFSFEKNLGCCHLDYTGNCDFTVQGRTAWYLEQLLPGWYTHETTGLKFADKYFRESTPGGTRHLIFDVWTHSGDMGFWPNMIGVYTDDFFHGDPNSGFLYTGIFGCASGQFVASERKGTYNYALSLIFGNSIGLASVGTPWGIGFGNPYKTVTYIALLQDGLSMGDSYYIASSQMFYELERLFGSEEAPWRINPYLYFGDPYLRMPDEVISNKSME